VNISELDRDPGCRPNRCSGCGVCAMTLPMGLRTFRQISEHIAVVSRTALVHRGLGFREPQKKLRGWPGAWTILTSRHHLMAHVPLPYCARVLQFGL